MLRLLSDLYAKVPPTELAIDAADQKSSRSDATLNMQRLLGSTLEELCCTWLKDRHSSKATGLSGAPLAHAAFLMRSYFFFIAATLRQSSHIILEKEASKGDKVDKDAKVAALDCLNLCRVCAQDVMCCIICNLHPCVRHRKLRRHHCRLWTLSLVLSR